MDHIGRYIILQEIGRGGMGVVYRCQAPSGEAVAIKVLLDHGSSSEAQRRRFVREADTLAQLDHPALVRVREYGQQSQNPYLVLDYVPGRTLSELLAARGRLPAREAAGLLARVASGLAHAHARGVVHRDIKPDNIRLTPQGQPVLVDFGLAKSIDLAHSRLTQEGRGLGTPGFWAPEQMAGNLDAVGPASDVYALGATLYMTLTGRPPFEGDSLIQLVAAASRPPTPLHKLVPDIPPALEAICLRCLAHDPKERYPTAAEAGDALNAWLDEDPSLEPQPASTHRGPLLIGLALVLLVGGLALWLGTGPSEPVATASPTPTPAHSKTSTPASDPTPSPTPSPTAMAVATVRLRPEDPAADERARSAILAGVTRVSLEGSVPGPVIAYGPRAFAVLSAEQRTPLRLHRAFVAAARYGQGRVVGFGHEDALKSTAPIFRQPDARRLLKNAFTWAGSGEIALLGGAQSEAQGLTKILGRAVRLATVSQIGDAQVVAWGKKLKTLPPAGVQLLRRHVWEGGGLVVARCPWGHQQIQARKDTEFELAAGLAEHQVLAPMGLVFDAEPYLYGTEPGPANAIVVDANQAARIHAGEATEEVFDPGGEKRPPALVYRVRRLLASLSPLDSLVLPRLGGWRRMLTDLVPSPSDPVVPSDRLRLIERPVQPWRLGPPEEVEPAAGVDAFPGAVPPAAKRIHMRVRTRRERPWFSTQAYAAPGEVVTITIEPFVPGWVVRIGVHPDKFLAKTWRRWPRIQVHRRLDQATTRVASPYGGPIHVAFRGNLLGDPCEITLGNVVRAPRFEQGVSSGLPSEQVAPAPWGELAGPEVRITAPSHLLRRTPDPIGVLGSWTRLRRLVQRLIPAPAGIGPLWLTFDVYPFDYNSPAPSPIPLPLEGETLPGGLDPRRILRNPRHLGVVAQHLTRAWLSGADSVTVSYLLLLSLRPESNRWSTRIVAQTARKAAALRARGGSAAVVAALRSDSSLIIILIRELNEAFGWAVFQKACAALSKRTRPAPTQSTRMHLWVEALSRAAGRNLIPFFRDRWGRSINAKTIKTLADLPEWKGPAR